MISDYNDTCLDIQNDREIIRQYVNISNDKILDISCSTDKYRQMLLNCDYRNR